MNGRVKGENVDLHFLLLILVWLKMKRGPQMLSNAHL